jgi:hypothetical protein
MFSIEHEKEDFSSDFHCEVNEQLTSGKSWMQLE